MMSKAMNKTVQTIIPQTLDQVITRHRELCSLHLSSDDDLAAMQKTIVAGDQDATDVIEDWHIVCLDRAPENGGKTHILLGEANRAGLTWSTSPLVGLDLGTGWAVTKSGSLYQLKGEKTLNAPSLQQVLHMCRTLHNWRVGKFLGVLEVF
jgi:hypothetical protein